MPRLPPPPFTGSTGVNSEGSVGAGSMQQGGSGIGGDPSSAMLGGGLGGESQMSGGGLSPEMIAYLNEIFKFSNDLTDVVQEIGASDSATDHSLESDGPFGKSNTVKVKMTQRKDTAANWTANNTVLSDGEIGYETDTTWHKIGDGVTAWNSLLYYHGPPWLTAVDGGNATSVFNGNTYPYYSVYSRATENTAPLAASWTEIEEIYDMQTDGTNILIVGQKPDGVTRAVWKTDHTLESVTEEATWDTGTFSNYNVSRYLEFIEYIPSLDRWITSTEQGDVYYSDDTGVTWTACTLPVGWSITAADITFMYWNADLGYLYIGSADMSVMPVSTDGITFVDQGTLQALGSPHEDKIYWAGTLEVGANKLHILSHWETYSWKDEDTGGSTGWTKTLNNGVSGGSGGLWTLMGWETDGTTVATYAFSSLSVNALPSIHGDWVEYTWTDLGFASNYNIHGILYVPEYDRPWIMAVNDAAGDNDLWFDAAAVTTGGAPSFAASTNSDLVGKALPKKPKWNARGGKMKRNFGNNWAVIFDESAAGGGVVDTVLIGTAN